MANTGRKTEKCLTMSSTELLFSTQEAGQTINVRQQEERRWLEFGDELIQTEINLDRPDYLPESFSRAMLAGVLFTDMPKRVLLAGAGGGSTARYFASRFPEVKGESVELSKMVIQLAKTYFECPHKDNWQLVEADIQQYVQDCPKRYDLIVIDIAINQYTPDWLLEHRFLTHCRQILTEQGHLSINLIVDGDESFIKALAAIRQVFDKQTVCLGLTEHKNILVFAYNKMPVYSHEKLVSQVQQLQREWQIEFADFYQQMLKDNPKGSGMI